MVSSFLTVRRSGTKRKDLVSVTCKGIVLLMVVYLLSFENSGSRFFLPWSTSDLELQRTISFFLSPQPTEDEMDVNPGDPIEDELYVRAIVSNALGLSEQNQNASWELDHSQVLMKLLSDTKRCSLNFHGLPRAFRTRVLPSIVRNILIPNAVYNCDVVVYYHHLLQEDAGRSGNGGTLDPDAVHLLRLAVLEVAKRARPGGGAAAAAGMTTTTPSTTTREPTVVIERFTDPEFVAKRGELLNKTRTILDARGKNIYVPYQFGFTHATIDNVVRMFHVLQGAFEIMERTAKELGISYIRVGIFRDDVFYTTPIDIFQIPFSTDDPHNRVIDQDNQFAVVPGFAQYPVNDRMFYGPYEAAKIYATQRFDLLEDHVRKGIASRWGMHPETFMNQTIFPTIKDTVGITIVADATICFVRARADDSLWVNDCMKLSLPGGPTLNETLAHVEETLGRKCHISSLKGDGRNKRGVLQALCE